MHPYTTRQVCPRAQAVCAYSFNALYIYVQVASLCNESGLSKSASGVWERVGESTEAALKVLCEKIGVAGQTLGQVYIRTMRLYNVCGYVVICLYACTCTRTCCMEGPVQDDWFGWPDLGTGIHMCHACV